MSGQGGETWGRSDKLYRWRIYQIAKKGRCLGTIGTNTDDVEEACEKAAKFFNITDPAQQRRLMAQREAE